jgi:membrane-bound ClpP family serine protease
MNKFALPEKNYPLLLVGLGIMVLGYILLSGGGSEDPNVFNYEMFSFRRLVVAPIVILAGFAFEIYAIMKKPKK